MAEEPKPSQYMLEGVKSETFIDSEFLGELEKVFKKCRVVTISVYVETDDGKDMITISYPFPVFEKNDQLIVDTQFPKTLEKIMKIIRDDERIYPGE